MEEIRKLKIILLVFTTFFSIGKLYAANQVQNIEFQVLKNYSRFTLTFAQPVKTKIKRSTNLETGQIVLKIDDAVADPTKGQLFATTNASAFPRGSVLLFKPYFVRLKDPVNGGTQSQFRLAVQLKDKEQPVKSQVKQQGSQIYFDIEHRQGGLASGTGPARVLPQKGKTPYNPGPWRGQMPIEDILENLVHSGVKKYFGKRISINFNKVPISVILKTIAESSGFNIILDNEILQQPPLTLSLTNVPWDQALDTILDIRKLVARKNHNILLVTTLRKATAERKQELEAESLRRKQQKTITKIFPISYAKLATLQEIVKNYLTKDTGKISLDERTNSLIIKDFFPVVATIQKLIHTLDTQTPQISIEAKIVEANQDFTKRVGLTNSRFKYNYVNGDASRESPGSGPGFILNSVPTASSFMGLQVIKKLKDLQFDLQLAETESKVKIISSPKVTTQNNQKAVLLSSEETSYPVSTLQNGVSLQTYEKTSADISLSVRPKVTPDGAISMEIEVNKEGFNRRAPQTTGSSAPPDKTSRKVTTNVLVENGSTVVIGGLYQVNESKAETGVPWVRKVPFLKWIFGSGKDEEINKTELIIFVTPRIVNQRSAGLLSHNKK